MTIIMMNSHGVAKAALKASYLVLIAIIALATLAVADEKPQSKRNDTQLQKQLVGDVLAKKLIAALNKGDEKAFLELFCSREAYVKHRVPEGHARKASDLAMKRDHEKAQINFMSDFKAFYNKDNGYSNPLNLRYISSRVIGPINDDLIHGLEILVQYGDNFGVGQAYIITGELCREDHGWSYLGRHREIYSPYPAIKRQPE